MLYENSTNLTGAVTCTAAGYQAGTAVGTALQVTCSGALSVDYDITYTATTLSVIPAPLTVTGPTYWVAYGDAVPANLGANVEGYVAGDSATTVFNTAEPQCTTTYVAGTAVAQSPVSVPCAALTAANYTITYVAGAITITRAPLIISVPSPTVVYGTQTPTFTPDYQGFVNTDDPGDLTGTVACAAATYQAGSAVGSSLQVDCSGASSSNYQITYAPTTLTITKAALELTGPTRSLTYGTAEPTDLIPAVTGYVAGDNATTVFGSANPQCTTTYTATTQVAQSPVSVPCTNLTAANYTIIQTPGSITVTPAALTITAPTITLVYGDPKPSLVPDYAGFVGADTAAMFGARECTTTYFAGHPVGQSPVGCSGFSAANYQISYVAGEITIGRATLTVVAPILTVAAGSEIPALTPGLEGFRNSETATVISKLPVCTTTYTPTSPGNATYRVSCTGAEADNYVFEYTAGQISARGARDARPTDPPAPPAPQAPTSPTTPTAPAAPATPTTPTTPTNPSTPNTTARPTPPARVWPVLPTIVQTMPMPGAADPKPEDPSVVAEGGSKSPNPQAPGRKLAVPLQAATVAATSLDPMPPGGRTASLSPAALATDSKASRTVSQFATEQLSGFEPGATATLRVQGAKTTGQFLIAAGTAIDPTVIVEALASSLQDHGTDFARLLSTTSLEDVALTDVLTGAVTKDAQELFEASSLGAPRTLGAFDLTKASHWVGVEAAVNGYAPGSVVYLVVTSDPIIFGSAIVGKDGAVELSGLLPLSVLEAGAHNIRLVGTRDLGGVYVDSQGVVQVGDETTAQIERFDGGTNAIVAISGTAPEGSHMAVRLIPLVQEIPWWTVLVYAAIGFFMLYLVSRRPDSKPVRAAYIGAAIVGALFPLIAAWITFAYILLLPTAIVTVALVVVGKWIQRRAHNRRLSTVGPDAAPQFA